MAKDWYNNIRMGHKWYMSTLECRLVEMCASEGTLQTPWRLLPALTFIEEDDADDHQSILRQLGIKYANIVVYGLNAFGPFVCFCSCYLKFKLWMQCNANELHLPAWQFPDTLQNSSTYYVPAARGWKWLSQDFISRRRREALLEKERPSIKSPGRLLFFILASEAGLGTTFTPHWSHPCWHNSHICTHEQSPLSLFPSSCLSLCRWAIEAAFQNLNIMLAKI